MSVAKFKEYVEPMIGHLVNVRLGHWDDSIRYLAACALGKLYIADPDYMMEVGEFYLILVNISYNLFCV